MKISLKKYAEALVVSLENEKDSKKTAQKINTLLKILTKRKQSKLIKRLPEIFKKIWLERNKQVEVTAVLPYETSPEELKKLEKLIEGVLKKEVFITTRIDKEIIGGMKLEFDDYLVDATVKTQLKNLKLKFAEAN